MGIFEFIFYGKLLYKLAIIIPLVALYLTYRIVRKYLKKRNDENNNDG